MLTSFSLKIFKKHRCSIKGVLKASKMSTCQTGFCNSLICTLFGMVEKLTLGLQRKNITSKDSFTVLCMLGFSEI